MSDINESGTVFDIMSSGTVSDIRNSGTVSGITISDFRNSTILNTSNWTISSAFRNNTCWWDTWAISPMNIYVYVHIILQCPLLIFNISTTKDDEELLSNKYNSAAQMFQMSIKLECCNKDVEQFFSSLSVGRNFNLFPILIREPPQFEGSAVRHSNPFVAVSYTHLTLPTKRIV